LCEKYEYNYLGVTSDEEMLKCYGNYKWLIIYPTTKTLGGDISFRGIFYRNTIKNLNELEQLFKRINKFGE